MDLETFLITLYDQVDTFCRTRPPTTHPGPVAALDRSEVVTLALLGQWARFQSERDFYRFADARLRPYFPRLPDRSQFNRLLRAHQALLAPLALHFADQLTTPVTSYELLDGTGVPVRNRSRRGRGWLPGLADYGWCTRLGFFQGFRLLVACDPQGVITGCGFSAASRNDRHLAETFFAVRAQPDPRLPSVGHPLSGEYLADTGFAGKQVIAHWVQSYNAWVCAAPQRDSRGRWPRALRRQAASWRQLIETVQDRLLTAFRLGRERPHALEGFQARLAAKVALHNFCCWLNAQLGRPLLAVADLLGW